MNKDNSILNPVQPYLELEVDRFDKVDYGNMGIAHFYEFSLENKVSHISKAVPDGSIDLLFNIGKEKVTTTISGTVFGVKPWELGSENKCFGVRFQPGQGVLPSDLSIDMLVNDDVEIDGNLYGDNITEQIALANCMEERINIFCKAYERYIYSRKSLSDKEKINDYLVNRIVRSKGQVSLNQLEAETNYSACYLRRIFKNYHGISPKQFAQYVRFQRLLEKLKESDCRNDDNAVECGYYDEAHMMKEFKKYAGVTLEQYKAISM